ncbi:pantoate--beta-alanine ligase [bacterium]|nr:pantoate--beta-alanine ligase [bacterium]
MTMHVEVEGSPERMTAAVQAARAAGRRVGFVPTMGALHAGHASLVEAAAATCDDVVVSIFVNPTQFGPREDFTRYPRPLAADLALLESLGARWAFTPSVDGIYPAGQGERVAVDGPAGPFEGAIRPGHFAGVATVVKRLFEIVPADVAFFGAKDWQQTRVIARLVHDRAIPIELVVCPTVREPDGLALSSRNAYLTPADRVRAVALHAGLAAAEACWTAGGPVAAAEAALRRPLEARGIPCDYAAIVDPESLAPLADPCGPAIALVAGRLGSTRLIDNRHLPRRPPGAV